MLKTRHLLLAGTIAAAPLLTAGFASAAPESGAQANIILAQAPDGEGQRRGRGGDAEPQGRPQGREAPQQREAPRAAPERREAPAAKEAPAQREAPRAAPERREAPAAKEAPAQREAPRAAPERREAPAAKEAPAQREAPRAAPERRETPAAKDAPASREAPGAKEAPASREAPRPARPDGAQAPATREAPRPGAPADRTQTEIQRYGAPQNSAPVQNTPPGAAGRPDQRPQPGATTNVPARTDDARDRDGRDRDRDARDRDGRDRDRDSAGRDRDGRDGSDRDRDRDRVGDRPRYEERDGRTFTRQSDNRVIIRQGDREIIRHDETERLRRGSRDVDVIERPNGRREIVIERPNGERVVTIVDRDGNLLRRVRRERGGREFVLIDNERRRPASGFYAPVELPPLRLNIPRERYIVEADESSFDVIEETLLAPPVERVERSYSLDEVRYNQRLREKVRRVDLDTITFETGSAIIAPQEAARLETIARALNDAIKKSPNEVFLIEGHTDAVGSDTSNLQLSDQRAESVATVLSQNFQIPPENLVTQGYGEQYLKVSTEAAERQNRRVTLRRITPLLQESQAR